MAASNRVLPPERRALVSDALLLTTAVAGSGLALVTLLSEVLGDTGWYSPVSSALEVAAVLVCPLVVWRLYRHRATLRSVGGAAVGFLGGGIVLWLLLMVVAASAFVGSWLTGQALSEGVVAFVVIAASLCALAAWLVVDGVRDLTRAHRHVGLDLERVVAVAVIVLTTAGALWWAWANPGEEPAELLAFALAAGVIGASVAFGADLLGSDVAPVGTAPQAPAT